MTTRQYLGVLSEAQIQSILSNSIVQRNREVLTERGAQQQYFNLELSSDIRQSITNAFGITLPSQVPMRWIQGDLKEHQDRGQGDFENTYLIYLTDSDGSLVIEETAYPIESGAGYVFNEGLVHKTVGTEQVPRLLIGPMSEAGFAVGAVTPITYYPTEADALAFINAIQFQYSDYTLVTLNGFSRWTIASNSGTFGPGPISSGTFNAGDTLLDDNGSAYYNVYPESSPPDDVICFREGTKILCQEDGKEVWKPIETIRKGTIVKTLHYGFHPVDLIGCSKIVNPSSTERTKDRLYKLTNEKYPELFEDLYLTGSHAIMVDDMTEEQKEESRKQYGNVYVTDDKYRLMTSLDERAEPYTEEGEYNIWNFSIKWYDTKRNFAVWANGLLVETSFTDDLITRKGLVLF
jgi:hypothetical protein